MMLARQIVSSEIAKELKEAGYPQEGLWWWVEEDGKMKIAHDLNAASYLANTKWVAPGAVELLEILPERLPGYKVFVIGTYNGNWVMQYSKIGNMLQPIRFDEEKLPDCVARMWLYLKNNKLLGELVLS